MKPKTATMFDRPKSSTERKIHGTPTLRPRRTTNTTSSYARTDILAAPLTVIASVTYAVNTQPAGSLVSEEVCQGKEGSVVPNEAGTSRPAGNERGLSAATRVQAK
jgi:hypothetical protein